MTKIVASKIALINELVAKFNKKAVKLSLPQVEVVVGDSFFEPRSVWTGEYDMFDGNRIMQTVHIEFLNVEVKGDVPRLDGWTIHSRVEATEVRGENFVWTSGAFAPVLSLRTTDMICQHCGHKRARANVYLLQHVDGRQILVGKTCLKDFLPSADLRDLVAYLGAFEELLSDAENFGSDEEGGWSFGGPASAFCISEMMTQALHLIKTGGYVSRKRQQETGEATTADYMGLPYKSETYQSIFKGEVWINQCQSGEDKKVIEYVNALNSGSDFEYNLQLAVRKTHAPRKLFGYIAAACMMYLKSLEKKAEAAVQLNEHFGTEKKREVFKLKVVGSTVLEGQYGYTYMYRFNDEAGRLAVWFASSNQELNTGDWVEGKATVKAHGEYKGTKQTVLTRCDFIKL